MDAMDYNLMILGDMLLINDDYYDNDEWCTYNPWILLLIFTDYDNDS